MCFCLGVSRSTGHSKVPVGVNVSVVGCLSICRPYNELTSCPGWPPPWGSRWAPGPIENRWLAGFIHSFAHILFNKWLVAWLRMWSKWVKIPLFHFTWCLVNLQLKQMSTNILSVYHIYCRLMRFAIQNTPTQAKAFPRQSIETEYFMITVLVHVPDSRIWQMLLRSFIPT